MSQKPKYYKSFERNSHWRKLSMIMMWERYCNASPKPGILFIFFVYIFIHISANMSLFGLKFSQMILHTETSKLMHNWSFLFVVLHKPTLLPSTFNAGAIVGANFGVSIHNSLHYYKSICFETNNIVTILLVHRVLQRISPPRNQTDPSRDPLRQPRHRRGDQPGVLVTNPIITSHGGSRY